MRPTARRILTQLNRTESRHALAQARAVFHGQQGQLRQRYREGQEDQLSDERPRQSGRLCSDCKQWRCRDLEERRRRSLEPRRKRWRPLTDLEVEQLLAVEPDELRDLVQALQRDRVPSRAIGKVLGHGSTWMAQHHPRPGWGDGPRPPLTKAVSAATTSPLIGFSMPPQ